MQEEVAQQVNVGRPVRLMFEDEARFGRLSEPQRCWAPKGVRPEVPAQIVREYEYAYAAVSPHDGVLDTLVLPKVNTEAMGLFLAEVAQRHPHEFIVMVLDGAGWHRAKRLSVPENMRLVPLPPWSPQLNPAEHLWDELREKYFANRRFESMDQLEKQLVTGLVVLESDAPRMASLTGFDWITCVPLNAN
ncbi:MAG TPA: IS630 family transposase [Candidatus Acidoferrum sp.]|nr:IS630 family transposase [Candidatus Acidoferrum sp.]